MYLLWLLIGSVVGVLFLLGGALFIGKLTGKVSDLDVAVLLFSTILLSLCVTHGLQDWYDARPTSILADIQKPFMAQGLVEDFENGLNKGWRTWGDVEIVEQGFEGKGICLGKCVLGEQGEQKAKRNSISRKVRVQNIPHPTLKANYRIVTSDILDWARFEVKVLTTKGRVLRYFQDGYNPPNRGAISENDLGWKEVYITNLEEVSDQVVVLEFVALGVHDGHLGICVVLDNIEFR